MANQPEVIQYDAGVYQIESVDPVDGGVSSITNRPLLALSNRTAWLKKHVDDLESGATLIDVYAPKNSPALTGTPTAPTQAAGDNSTKIANTAFVQSAVNGQVSVNIAGSANTTLTVGQYGVSTIILTGAVTGNKAVIFPASAGRCLVINRATGAFTVTCKTASGTGVVVNQGASNAIYCDGTNIGYDQTDYVSIALTGSPTAPTAANSDTGQQVANAAFVRNVLAMLGLGDNSLSAVIADMNDATTLSGLYYVAPTTTNNPIAGTFGTVIHKIYGAGGLQIYSPTSGRLLWRRRVSAVWQTWNDFANLDSPDFTGTPTAPTAALGTDTQQIATMAALIQALASYGFKDVGTTAALDLNTVFRTSIVGMSSATINGPSGFSSGSMVLVLAFSNTNCIQMAMSRTSDAVSYRRQAAGVWQSWKSLAFEDSPSFTGNATAPTVASTTNNTQIATTEFVQAQKVSPALSGMPTAPTIAQFATGQQIVNADALKASGVQFSTVRGINLSVANISLTVADVGSLIVFTGSGGGTLTLPKANTVPAGGTITIRANNTAVSTNTLKAASGDTLTGALQSTSPAGVMRSGDSVTAVSDGATSWHLTSDTSYNFVTQAVAQWFSSGQQLGATSYQKLPSGIIIQSGVSPVAATGSYISLPFAFPTAFVGVVTTPVSVTLPGTTANNNVGSESKADGLNRFIARVYLDSVGIARNANWIAFGY